MGKRRESEEKQAVLPDMPEARPAEEAGDAEVARGKVRLRRPNRKQMEMVVQCPDDLVSVSHPVRRVWAVVEQVDLSGFYESVKAREGVVGRDATDPQVLVGIWLWACVRGIGAAREVDRQCKENAAFRWLCGGVTVNYHMLSDFRVEHGQALDDLLTQIIAALVSKKVVSVRRISQDGMRIRVSVGASSFRREQRLEQLLREAREHIERLRAELDSPAKAAGVSAKKAAAQRRAARERKQRLEAAIAQLPEVKKKQEEAAKKAGNGKSGEKIRQQQPRVSTTDAEARRMKMANGGFNPAVNVQLATDTKSRAVLGVEITYEGSDSADLSQPMREQVEKRTGRKVKQHLVDGGYMRLEDIEEAHQRGVQLFVPGKPARNPDKRGHELDPKAADSRAIRAWKRRMSSAAGQEIYKQRAATSETVNADLRCYRGLRQLTLRGVKKIKCAVLWCVLAYSIMHFGTALQG